MKLNETLGNTVREVTVSVIYPSVTINVTFKGKQVESVAPGVTAEMKTEVE